MISLKVPFRMGIVFIEKDVWFSFGLGSMEYSSKEVLKCGLNELSTKTQDEMSTAILYGAYIQACRERYKKPKYKLEHAAFWLKAMSDETKKQFTDAYMEVLGEYTPSGEKKKK